jgi:hypothetical protein
VILLSKYLRLKITVSDAAEHKKLPRDDVDDGLKEANFRNRHNVAWALAIPCFEGVRREAMKLLRKARDLDETPDSTKVSVMLPIFGQMYTVISVMKVN